MPLPSAESLRLSVDFSKEYSEARLRILRRSLRKNQRAIRFGKAKPFRTVRRQSRNGDPAPSRAH
jgi:hypothetical protein